MITQSDDGQDFDPEDPLTVILRPAPDHLGLPPGRYEKIRRGAARRRLLRIAVGVGLSGAVAALVALPLRMAGPQSPAAPAIPLGTPPASSSATRPVTTPTPRPAPTDGPRTAKTRPTAQAPSPSAATRTGPPGRSASATPTATPTATRTTDRPTVRSTDRPTGRSTEGPTTSNR
ncbi:hypothetical protein [Streptomyces sp. CBMA29]|uniref:hypothetical protein n=1 Tax=Streptomyces sp. CBMA29 TaxID=1896314 RepID=UPI001661D11C|nr:hypothetical protein [Streptomyces sp. CBMA29]MBD0738277.1 hypothetical protein [Streptomyces sp. CBMA29]